MSVIKELFYILAIITVGVVSVILLKKSQKINDLLGDLKDAQSDLKLEKLRDKSREARNKYVQAYTKYIDAINDAVNSGDAVVFSLSTDKPVSAVADTPEIKH